MNFASLGLCDPILRALTACSYENPTPIQQQAIPPALAGRDVLGCARTGTGKTCAFGAPILQRLSETPCVGKHVRALILTPTRELALQIEENLAEYSSNLKLKTAVIFGGVGQNPQVAKLARGVDVLTATPGRLLDLQQQKLIDLSKVEIFVLDEADRMLDMGFIHDVRKIVALLPKKKQTLFFSATMPDEITDLVNSLLHDPVRVAVDPVSSPVEVIDQRVYMVDRQNKTKLLAEIIGEEKVPSALVFTRTKHGADKVVRELSREHVKAAAIHGNKSQTARQAALYDFKAGKLQVLVATDIAARGIDIDDLAMVFNYNLPEVPETYVHRIGRTGRAGKGGSAIAFCDFSEQPWLRAIEKLIGKPLPIAKEHNYPMQDFEAIKRDKKGKMVNAEDEEARSAARERRAERQQETKLAKVAKEAKAAAKAAAPKLFAPVQKKGQPIVPVQSKGSVKTEEQRRRAKRPQGRPGAALPAHPQEIPEELLRPSALEGERIMDATARMFAKRAPLQATAKPGKANPAEADNPARASRNRRRGEQKSQAPAVGQAAAIVAEKQSKSPNAVREQKQPLKQSKEGRGHGNRRRIPTVEGPRSRQKDSTEQHSLMKPFYLDND